VPVKDVLMAWHFECLTPSSGYLDVERFYVQNLNNDRKQSNNFFSLFHRAFRFIKVYSHQLMHFFIQLCISLLSYIKIT